MLTLSIQGLMSWTKLPKGHCAISRYTWRRHQMETFSALLAFCAGNSPVPGEFPAQRPVTRSFDAFFDLHLNKQLSKQSWGWWFEAPSLSLWCHCNGWPVFCVLTHWALVQGLWIQISNFQTDIKDDYLKHFLWNLPLVNATRPCWWLVKIDSG